MKNILFIIGLFLAVSSFGQSWIHQMYVRAMFPINETNPQYGHINPASNNNITSAYPCDSVWFFIDYTEQNPTNTNGLYFSMYIIDTAGVHRNYSSISYSDFKKSLIPNTSGTGYKLKYKIPCDLKAPYRPQFFYQFAFGNSYLKNSYGMFYVNAVPVTTSIINPLEEKNIKITYYSIQGIEVKKPNEGLYIWKSENGESGKIYINQVNN